MQILRPDNVPALVKASDTTITMSSTYLGQTARITVGGQQYKATSALAINAATVGVGGLDTGTLAAGTLYYIYAVVRNGTLGLIMSTNGPAVGPVGFKGAKEVGRARTYYSTATLAAVANRILGGERAPIDGTWKSYTQNVTADTTNPTLAATLYAVWRINGPSTIEFKVWYAAGSGSAGTAGSGLYNFNLPEGFRRVPGVIGTAGNQFARIGGAAFMVNTGASLGGHTYLRDDSVYNVAIYNSTSTIAGFSSSLATHNFGLAGLRFMLDGTLAVAELTGLYDP